MTRVAAAVLWRDGRILICRRGPGGSCAGLWEFPGGKVEPGESGAACAVRECREELGIEIRLSGELGEASYRYPEREVSLCFFEGTVERGEPRAQVHSELRWAAPEEIERLAGLENQQLHELYEKARYSPDGCTAQENRALKI